MVGSEGNTACAYFLPWYLTVPASLMIGCHLSWLCSTTHHASRTILASAIISRDDMLEGWMERVFDVRRTYVAWNKNRGEYRYGVPSLNFNSPNPTGDGKYISGRECIKVLFNLSILSLI